MKLYQATADLCWVKHPSFPFRCLGRAPLNHCWHPSSLLQAEGAVGCATEESIRCPWNSPGQAARQLFSVAGSTPAAARCSAGPSYGRAKAWKNQPQMGKSTAPGPTSFSHLQNTVV